VVFCQRAPATSGVRASEIIGEVEVEARADAALINDRQGTKFTFDCPSDSFEIGVRLVAV
jgi:hypothetical protein